MNTAITSVSTIGKIFDVPSASSTNYFQAKDFDWVNAGLVANGTLGHEAVLFLWHLAEKLSSR